MASGALQNVVNADIIGGSLSIPSTTETLVLTAPAIAAVNPSGFFLVLVSVNLALGAATTAINVNVYRGVFGSGGIQVLSESIHSGITGGQAYAHTTTFGELLLDAGPIAYSFTVKQTSATGAGTVTNASISVIVN